MKRFNRELYYIVPLDNILGIIQNGILCHDLAEKTSHISVALEEVQSRRAGKRVPEADVLHKYVNLYFNPRNPMMYKIRGKLGDICVLGISDKVLDLSYVVVSDMNAARDLARFYSPQDALKSLNFDEIYLLDWNHPEESVKYHLQGAVCSEVLVPQIVDYQMVTRAFVANESVEKRLRNLGFSKQISINPKMFFAGS